MTEIPVTLMDAAAALRDGSLTSAALTRAVFERADALDARLGVYITRMADSALAAAEAADRDFAAGIDRGPLQGIPIGIKDIIATKDAPTTAQSLILDPAWGEGIDAPVVARLRAAGAIITGKTSTMEFATGMPDPAKPFPVPHNPWDLERWTGGSSSGSGGGVSAGLFLGALGTDTGGSIRGPAAYCGISGLKPTHGRVPKSGCAPLGYSLDHIGPMARSAADCAAMLQALAGFDATDRTCADVPVPMYLPALTGSVKGMRIAVDRENHVTHPQADRAAIAAFEDAVAWFASAGAVVEEVVIPYFQEIRAANTITSRGEAGSYHLGDLRSRWEDYGVHTSKSLANGTMLSAADYIQAQRFRSLARRLVADLMAPYDALLTPTALMGAPLLEGLDHTSMGTFPTFTAPWNFLGLPALSIPMGFTGGGLPVSLQIVGKPFAEATVLRAGDAYQRDTDYHRQLPPILQAVAV